MALKITRPDGRTVTEPAGGALLDFVDGVARVTGYVSQLRPSVVAAIRRRGWSATNTRQRHTPAEPPSTPTPPTPAPTDTEAPDADVDDQAAAEQPASDPA